MKSLFLTTLLGLLSFFGFSQTLQLSEFSQISIITVGPGDSLVDCFGHSAIRVKDPLLRLDEVFNYGTYDFEEPNFVLKFAQGKLLYKLGHNSFSTFLNYYKQQNRYVKEQILDLDKKERQQYFSYLINNAKPENSSYLYDFFYDNCATKLRDVSGEVLKDKVIFHYSFTKDKNETLRDLIHNYSFSQPWGTFGIDVALGSIIDREAKPEEYAFLPDYIFNIFNESSTNKKPLVKETINLYETKTKESSTFLTPLFTFSLISLLVIYLTFRDYKKNKRTRILDFLLFFITGIVGVFVLLLWFATDHSATANNFNFLWAFPFNIIIAFLFLNKNIDSWISNYLLLLKVLLIATVLLWIFKIQIFNLALIPILLMLFVRYFYLRKTII